jgi:glycosyltransferase involved in cell wall biosynthesis
MEKMTRIVCVSQGTAKVFSQRHPHLKVPIDYCYNIQNIDRILHLSGQEMPTAISGEHFNCFSACRFSPQKDIPRAVRALAPTLKSHPDVRWYIAGEGAELSEVKQLIAEYGLEESVILLGSLANPYPYFANCDLYIQPSIYEAAPMVYGEAMICKIPILTTDNISAQEMVPSAFGIICENSEEGLKNSFAQIIRNRGMVAEMKKNLEANEYSNQGILEKLDSLFT